MGFLTLKKLTSVSEICQTMTFCSNVIWLSMKNTLKIIQNNKCSQFYYNGNWWDLHNNTTLLKVRIPISIFPFPNGIISFRSNMYTVAKISPKSFFDHFPQVIELTFIQFVLWTLSRGFLIQSNIAWNGKTQN